MKWQAGEGSAPFSHGIFNTCFTHDWGKPAFKDSSAASSPLDDQAQVTPRDFLASVFSDLIKPFSKGKATGILQYCGDRGGVFLW